MSAGSYFNAESIFNYGDFAGSQASPTFESRLLEIHGNNPNATGYYLGFVRKQTTPIVGDELWQPIWVPTESEFSWVPFGQGWPGDVQKDFLWWCVSSTPDVWTPTADEFFVSVYSLVYL